MSFPAWMTGKLTDKSNPKGPDDLLQDFRDHAPIDSIDTLKARAQSLADRAVVAQAEADTARANAEAAKAASDSALQAVFEAEQAQRKAKADELSKVAADAAQVAALAQAAAVAAQTSASEARAEFQGDQQTCPNCGTMIPGFVAGGRLVNCPKCDRNFPAQ